MRLCSVEFRRKDSLISETAKDWYLIIQNINEMIKAKNVLFVYR